MQDFKGLVTSLREPHNRFLDWIEGVRPDLFRYCRSLTSSVWDAEDLVQDTLLAAFAKLPLIFQEIRDPRAYLFRMATRLWIDHQRREGWVERLEEDPMENPEDSGTEIREAAATLFRHLPPRERASLLLKEVFGFSLIETAEFLETTLGAVKAALHRARHHLQEAREGAAPPTGRPPPSEALLDAYVDAFNRKDLGQLSELLAEDVAAEVVGIVQEYGRQAVLKGSLEHTVPDPDLLRTEWRTFHGERVLLLWNRRPEGERVGDVERLEEREGLCTRIRHYYYSPEVIQEVAGGLGLPFVTQGYRHGCRVDREEK